MTPEQQAQIDICRHWLNRGMTVQELRAAGYAEAAISHAFGVSPRDPENLDPYGPQNHPITRPGNVEHDT